jgi:hypothetical protein
LCAAIKSGNNYQEEAMTSTRTTAVTVLLGQALAEQLTDQAQSEGTTCADVLRRALEKYAEGKEQRAMLEDMQQNILARL